MSVIEKMRRKQRQVQIPAFSAAQFHIKPVKMCNCPAQGVSISCQNREHEFQAKLIKAAGNDPLTWRKRQPAEYAQFMKETM